MREKKPSKEEKSDTASKPEGIYSRLEIVLNVIYGILIPIVMVTLAEQTVGPTEKLSDFSIELVALFLMGLYMVEECCNVILINSIKPYSSADRFTADILTAILFYFTFTAIDNNRIVFIYFLTAIHFLNFIWALTLLMSEMDFPKLPDYLKLTVWTNALACLSCAIIVALSLIFKAEFWFETIVICYFMVYLLLIFSPTIIMKYRRISLPQKSNSEEVNSFIRGSWPILTNLVFYAILFVFGYILKRIGKAFWEAIVLIGKATWEAVTSYFKDLFGRN